MTDRYEKIRQALAMGPTPGPRRAVEQSVIGPQDLRILSANVTFSVGVNGSHSVLIEEAVANAALAAACDPDTIRELLAERDQLAAALEAAREDGWQPMETAPKDGTHVMLWIEWIDNRGIPIIGNFRLGRWFSSCCYGGNVASAKSMEPLYWRPLPAPPAIDQARGEEVQS